MTSYKPSLFRTEKAPCFVARYSRGAIVIKRRPAPGVAALVPRALTPGYRALAPDGAAQGVSPWNQFLNFLTP